MSTMGPAAYASDLLPCQLDSHDRGWQIDWTSEEANGFVAYQTFPASGAARNRVYLEHCESGQVLRAEFTPDPAAPLGLYFLDRVQGPDVVTMSGLAAELKARGAKTRLRKSRKESCACAYYYPQARGKKRPYQPK